MLCGGGGRARVGSGVLWAQSARNGAGSPGGRARWQIGAAIEGVRRRWRRSRAMVRRRVRHGKLGRGHPAESAGAERWRRRGEVAAPVRRTKCRRSGATRPRGSGTRPAPWHRRTGRLARSQPLWRPHGRGISCGGGATAENGAITPRRRPHGAGGGSFPPAPRGRTAPQRVDAAIPEAPSCPERRHPRVGGETA